MVKKIGLSIFGLALLVAPAYVFADQIADLQAQVQALMAQIMALQGNAGSSYSAPSPASSTNAGQCVPLPRNLQVGMSGGDVTELQQFLNISPATGYFGPITLRAVQQWQSSHSLVFSGTPLTTGYGSVGPKTRAVMSCAGSASQGNTSSTAPSLYTLPTVNVPSPSTYTQAPTTPTTVSTTADYVKSHGLLLITEPSSSGDESIYTIRTDGSEKTFIATGRMPSWTPDGKIIFVSDRNGARQIWIMDADGSNAREISHLPPATSSPTLPQMAKNGLIVYESAPCADGNNENIWIMNSDGTRVKQLACGMQPSIALSGSWISYTFETENPYHREIYRINTDGTGEKQLTFLGDTNYPDANASSISPNEKWIAFFSGKEAAKVAAGSAQDPSTFGYRNVAIIPADGGARVTLTHCWPLSDTEHSHGPDDCFVADDPAWSPDSQWILHNTAFVSTGGILMIDINGNNEQKILLGHGTVRVPLKYVN